MKQFSLTSFLKTYCDSKEDMAKKFGFKSGRNLTRRFKDEDNYMVAPVICDGKEGYGLIKLKMEAMYYPE